MSLSPAQIDRFQRKALAALDAWGALFGTSPSGRALVRVLSIAEFESRLGDARGWKGEHNWGAVKKRPLTAAERATLAARGISAEGGDAALLAARQVLAPTANDEALHIDQSPGEGHHFAWFWAFPSDAAAATKFLQVLVRDRPSVRAALEQDDVTEVARAMYRTHYFEGLALDPDTNIRAYAARLREKEAVIAEALAASPVPESPDSAPSPPLSRPPSVRAARSGTAGVHLFFGALVLVLGSVLARGAHR